MLKNVTRELQPRLNEESTGKQVGSIVPDKELGEYKVKCEQLKRQMHESELQLLSRNGKIAALEIQIQSENFSYQRKCKEMEEHLLAFRSKIAELNSKVMKLQKAVNDVNAWECEICRRWRVNRKDQACQTISNDALRFCSTNSGIVGGRCAKKNKQIDIEENPDVVQAPRSFVIHRGLPGEHIRELAKDFHRIMEPFTAMSLKERKKNTIKDFVSIASVLHVSHMCIFTRAQQGMYFKLCYREDRRCPSKYTASP